MGEANTEESVRSASEIPAPELEKLCGICDRILQAKRPKEVGVAKGQFTKLVNKWGTQYPFEVVRSSAQTVVQLFFLTNPENESINELFKQVTPGPPYSTRSGVRGWYDPSQLQAELLPMSYCRVDFEGFYLQKELWEKRGFAMAWPLPYDLSTFDGAPILKVMLGKIMDAQFWESYGYANPVSLQWQWDDKGLCVTRNIKHLGFWNAYKWWAGCQDWYYEKHPEWFCSSHWDADVALSYFCACVEDSRGLRLELFAICLTAAQMLLTLAPSEVDSRLLLRS